MNTRSQTPTAPADRRTIDPETTQRDEARHVRIRQSILAKQPEGREPAPRMLHLSWLVFHAVLVIAVAGLFAFLWSLGGWSLVLPGIIVALCLYFIAYWAIYAALALRLRDKLRAERKAEKIERIVERHK